MHRHIPRKDGCLPAGRGFHWSLPLLTFSSKRSAGEADSQLASRQSRKASHGKYTQNTQLRVSHNLLYDVIPSSKGITTNLYGGTNKKYGGVCPCWMFHDYYFLVLLLDHFPDDGSMSSSRKLIHTTTIPIPTASLVQKYHFSYSGFRLDFLLPSSGKQQIASP